MDLWKKKMFKNYLNYGTPLYPLLVYCNDPLDDQTTMEEVK